MDTRELRQKRVALADQARAITDKAETEKRAMSAEELQEHGRLFNEIDALRGTIEATERQAELTRSLAQSQGTASRGEPGATPGNAGGETRTDPYSTPEYRSHFASWLQGERRDLQADKATAGGYWLPTIVANETLQNLGNEVFVRRLARKYQVAQAESLGVPYVATAMSDAEWTSELSIATADTSMAVGRRELYPKPLSKHVKVSRKLLRTSPQDAEGIVMAEVVRVNVETEENGFLNGSGSGQPMGIFTASDLGISTARDMSTGNTATSITFDGLINARMHLKPGYRSRPTTGWIFGTEALTQIFKLKDGEGRYYAWQPSLLVGQPDRILGIPVFESAFCPHVFTASLYVGCLADFSMYCVGDALSMEITRLDELYAGTNQVGFISRREVDGMPGLEEAFVRVKLAAA